VIDVVVVVKLAIVSAEVCAEGSECEKDQAEEQLTLDVSTSAMVRDA
jgi:hypothetical protein